MSSSLLELPPLNTKFYASWKKEMCLWQLAMNIPPAQRAPAVFLSLKSQAHAAILEMNMALLHSDDGIDKLIEKLDTLFLKDKKISPRSFAMKILRVTTMNHTSWCNG